MFFTILFCFGFALPVLGNAEYKGYKVYKIDFQNEEQQNKFHLIKSDGIDYLRKPSFKYNVVGKAMVPPSHIDWFEEKLEEIGVNKDVAIEDLYEYLQESNAESKTTADDGFSFENYHRYDTIVDYMQNLESQYQNSTDIDVKLIQGGLTDEGRPLVYLKVAKPGDNKTVIIVEAGINPREWITVPAAVNVANKLIEERRFLDNFDWIVIPLVNPDGYEYTHTNLRLWTKNRSVRSNLGYICPGVNINRNFDIDWSVSDSSSSPCSHLYSGIAAFSEPESYFIRSIHEEYNDRIQLYISLQNSGGFVAYPWQYERAASGMFRQHYLLGSKMAEVMGSKNLDIGSLAYGDRASGTVTDYLTKNGVLYAFNVDVEGKGTDNVEVPESEIKEVVDRVWRTVAVAAEHFLNENT